MPEAGERRLKYLEMLQAVIARMASNQFTIRASSVALVTAIIGFAAAKEPDLRMAALALLPAVCFWVLDAYYLTLERGYRDLFEQEAVVARKDVEPCFNMKVTAGFVAWWKNLWARAVWLTHLPLVLIAGGLAVWAFRSTTATGDVFGFW
jgi:hypothetical protein